MLGSFASTAIARPAENRIPRPHYTDLNPPVPAPSTPGIFGAATGPDTMYFGGTVWAPDSARWEALPDSCWTFDSGVGSHFQHGATGVDPSKDPSLHAYMEGWVGINRAYVPIPYFRRLTSSQFPTGQNNCVLNGSWSFWAGVLDSEAPYLCYADGQGYGNDWNVCIEHDFTYNGTGDVTVQYAYKNDTELDFDFTYFLVDTTGSGAEVEVAAYTDLLTGTGLHTLTPGVSLRSTAGPVTFRFCVVSDGAFSDEDGSYTTRCGAFALDDLSVTGGGITYSSGFEADDGGWILSPSLPGDGGEWSSLVHLSDLPPPQVDCACNLQDTVMVFEDLIQGSGHNYSQNNFAASPWIDLQAAGVVGVPGKFIEMNIYGDLPLLNYIYAQFFIQWYPYVCPSGGKIIRSPWVIDGVTHYFGGYPSCTQVGGPNYRSDFSALIDPGAEQVRIGIGVFSACLFYPNCTGLTNSSPWFDDVRFGVCGTISSPSIPALAARAIDLPQDAFPEDGSLNLASTGRVDAGTVKGGLGPGPMTTLGDTLVVQGGNGGAEVWVQFAVRPGPGVVSGSLTSFLAQLTAAGTSRGLTWYTARMDTAEQGGVLQSGYWMTAFHESYPAFSGKDTDKDAGDLDPWGGLTRLANDIFPDDLFTAGTRLQLFYKTKFTASSTWFVYPDTTGGRYLEMEVLPSSIDAESGLNCVLYVNRTEDWTAPVVIEDGLAAVLPGGSPNFENVAWDRYDVRAASSNQATFGRPNGTEYGASVPQAMGYRAVVWNTGNLDTYTLVDEDASILTPWLLLFDSARTNNLYMSGDGLVAGIVGGSALNPIAYDLLTEVAGVDYDCDTFSGASCPSGTVEDLSACVDLDPVGGAVVSTRPLGGSPQGRGNGCPWNRSFDVFDVKASPRYGGPVAEEQYVGEAKSADYASVSSSASGNFNYRTVVDGVSLHYRRDPGDCLNTSLYSGAATERLTEVLGWFGMTGPDTCSDPSIQIGIGDDLPGPGPTTALAPFFPNPLRAGSRGEVQFSLRRGARARVEIHDVQGRVVKTIFDGTAAAGSNRADWDGTGEDGRPVAAGVYFTLLRAEGQEIGKRLVVLPR